VTTYADLKLDNTAQCYLSIEMKISQNETNSAIKMKIQEVPSPEHAEDKEWKTTCFPNSNDHIIIDGDTDRDEEAANFMTKASHFSFIMTSLAIVATFFTIAELKAVSRSLEEREMVGQRENHAKRLSLLSNCMVCMWNMCYSISYFVAAVRFKVSSSFK
jgi:hypothetical protein